jgi:hypothetical protein
MDRSSNDEPGVVELMGALEVDGKEGLGANDSRVEDLSLSSELLTSGDDCWERRKARGSACGSAMSILRGRFEATTSSRHTESSGGRLSSLGVPSSIGEDEQELRHTYLTNLAKLGAGVNEFDDESLEGRRGVDGVRFLDMSKVQSDEPVCEEQNVEVSFSSVEMRRSKQSRAGRASVWTHSSISRRPGRIQPQSCRGTAAGAKKFGGRFKSLPGRWKGSPASGSRTWPAELDFTSGERSSSEVIW